MPIVYKDIPQNFFKVWRGPNKDPKRQHVIIIFPEEDNFLIGETSWDLETEKPLKNIMKSLIDLNLKKSWIQWSIIQRIQRI